MIKFTALLAGLLALFATPSTVAQVTSPKPVSKGFLGKTLPSLKGEVGSKSHWLKVNEASPNQVAHPLKAQLVVFTSPP